MDSISLTSNFNSILKKPKILVIGIGSGGCGAIKYVKSKGVDGVKFCALACERQCLEESEADSKILLGEQITNGDGTGSDPSIGAKAAEESREEIEKELEGVKLLFVTTTLGGGTGTGVTPFIAKLVKEKGIPTIFFIMKDFSFIDSLNTRRIEDGIKELKQCSNSIITISLDETARDIDMRTKELNDAFSIADNIVYDALKGIIDFHQKKNLSINKIDLNDIIAATNTPGGVIVNTGVATGDNKARNALENALNNPLLEDNNIDKAKYIYISFSTSENPILSDIREACDYLAEEKITDSSGTIFKYCVQIDKEVPKDSFKVFIFATGIPDKSFSRYDFKYNKYITDTIPNSINESNSDNKNEYKSDEKMKKIEDFIDEEETLKNNNINDNSILINPSNEFDKNIENKEHKSNNDKINFSSEEQKKISEQNTQKSNSLFNKFFERKNIKVVDDTQNHINNKTRTPGSRINTQQQYKDNKEPPISIKIEPYDPYSTNIKHSFQDLNSYVKNIDEPIKKKDSPMSKQIENRNGVSLSFPSSFSSDTYNEEFFEIPAILRTKNKDNNV